MTAGRTTHSQSVNWCTPSKYVEAIKKVFDGDIELDPCSNPWSIVGAKTEFTLPQSDGLLEKWNHETIYVNPPYGSDRERKTTIKHWLYKCFHAYKHFHFEVLALIPVATNTSHWKEYVWGRNYDKFLGVFLEFGAVVDLRELLGKAIGDKSTPRQSNLFLDGEELIEPFDGGCRTAEFER